MMTKTISVMIDRHVPIALVSVLISPIVSRVGRDVATGVSDGRRWRRSLRSLA